MSPAYISLCRGLEYVLKMSYFNWNHSNMAGFLIFETVFLAVLEKRHKNEGHLCLVAHIFIKLEQNVYLVNIHILKYWDARCGYKLWKFPWLCCVFCEFSHIISNHSCLICWIFTKLSQTVYLTNTHNLVYRYARCDCRSSQVIWSKCVFWDFLNIITY